MTIHSDFGLVAPTSHRVSQRPLLAYQSAPKRALDIILVVLSLPVALPLVLVCMALVALDGYSPIYRQQRLGRDGRIYSIFKLRTMVPDADAALQKHLEEDPEAHAEWCSLQKLRCDPRVTRVGQFLRKSSLDELPQLWNVLRGDMSVVGPRPMMVEQARLYPGRSYYALRPGITGRWQVSDRNQSSFADRAAHDDAYADSLTLGTDAAILWKTVGVVLRGTGC